MKIFPSLVVVVCRKNVYILYSIPSVTDFYIEIGFELKLCLHVVKILGKVFEQQNRNSNNYENYELRFYFPNKLK